MLPRATGSTARNLDHPDPEGRLHPVAAAAERVLREHPHPALTLSELVQLLERVDRNLDQTRLRGILEQHPERFRVLDPWHGAWCIAEGEGGPTRDVWVVIIEDPTPSVGASDPTVRLRESVRWLARGVDPRSAGEVSRWYAIACSEREVRSALRKRAA